MIEMSRDEILFSRFSEPAVILAYHNDKIEFLKINDKFLREIGMNIDEKEFLGSDPFEPFDETNKVVYLNTIKECIGQRSESTCQTWRTYTSGCCGTETISVKSRFVYLESENDTHYVFEAIRNTTAERRTLDDLVEGERRFKIASDQVNIYYWEYTVATKEMRPCFRCMRDLGLPALVKNYPEPAIAAGIFPPDYADMYRDWHKQIAAGVKELEAVKPLTVGRVPFRVRYNTEFDENGKPYKAYGSATIVHQAELDKNKLDSTIIEALADDYDAIVVANLVEDSLDFIKISEDLGADYLKGLSYSDGVRTLMPLFIEEYGEDIGKFNDIEMMRTKFFANVRQREMNFKNRRRGQWVRVIFQPVDVNDGMVNKMMVTYSILDDLRSQKMDDDRLIAKQKKELEERQDQLVRAVDAANRANRAKSDFLARMSHEIRTPMNAIMGMNEIIVKCAEDESVKSYAKDAYMAATGLLGTINEILDFSKIESGKMELVNDKFGTGRFFNNLYTMFALRAEDKNLSLVYDVDRNLPSILLGDELRLKQVLINLLSNAVKYTDQGTVTFKAVNKGVRDGKTEIFFSVSDTGRGIKEEDMGRLFDAFERIDEKQNRSIEGSGLGLSIAVRLIRMMGAELDVKSTFGKGSEFSFSIQLEAVDETPMGDYDIAGEEQTAEEKPMYTSNGSILVVDDNNVNLKVISALLKETGMRISAIPSGEMALRATAQKKYDIIFMDHYMPGMDGVETFQKIRAQENGKNQETPVIVLTANAIKGQEDEYRSLGFDDVVYKPTTQQELNRVLWKFLG